MNAPTNTSTIDLPQDTDALQEMVLNLLKEKEALVGRVHYWQEKVNILVAKLFGRSSEKGDPMKGFPVLLGLFDEAEQIQESSPDEVEEEGEGENKEETTPVAGHQRKKRGRKPLPDWLPRVEIVHELPESERICDLDESLLTEIGREISEQLDIIPAQVRVIRHIRIKYGCPHCHQGVKTAPAPKRPIPKALATAALLAHVAVAKYADGLPLYRQGDILTRAGIDLSRSTLANWMIQAGNLVQPLINLLRDQLLSHGVIQMDETTVQVLNEPGKKATTRSYMWVQRGTPAEGTVILFDYDPSRSGSVPKNLLAEYQGYLQTDGYDGYLAVGADPHIIHVGCWAHARRKFDEAIKAMGRDGKGKPGKAGQAMALIRKLYLVEKDLREAKADPQTRFEVRHARAGPILDELKTWLDKNLPTAPPKTALGVAMGYLNSQWPRLIRYLEDGRLEIDNNGVENAIRPFVIGRKGWLFSDSVRGVKASANLYSIIETAKANGLEPFAYLRHIFTALPTATTLEDFEKLLPWNIDQAALSIA
ncbi:MAG: IS66 family transposase [Magnetococcales bacterium]|nr:IS66 family transposase [Magnetococcales bacterium]